MAPPHTAAQGNGPPPWLWLVIGSIVVIGLGIAGYAYSGRKAEQKQQNTAFAQEQQLAEFQRFVRDRIGEDITRAGQSAGFCARSCESFWPDAGAVQTWQFRANDAVLLAFLFGEWDFFKQTLQYRLKLQWSSTREDGDLAPVAPKLQQLVDTILRRYNYPPEFLFPTPRSLAERGNSSYTAIQSPYYPSLGHIYHHTGHEKLRGERLASITRKGPFTGEGSWLREK